MPKPNKEIRITSRTKRHLRYTDAGRSGTIHYLSQKTRFDLWYELAGGNAVAIIGIPAPQHWASQTHTSLLQRTRMLRYIGRQVINDRLSGDGYFLFDDSILTIYSGKIPADQGRPKKQ